MIETRALTYRLAGRALVDDVSVDFPAATVTALVGPNGAGKSTLLKLLAGDLPPASGSVEFGGCPLAGWSETALARRRAVVMQFNPLAFPYTVREVVALGRLPHRGRATASRHRAAVDGALRRMDVLGLATRLYPTLSGGEQQRVAVARALAQVDTDEGPPCLLLDEPTASLDLEHQQALMALTVALAREGATVVVVLHDLNLARAHADRVVVLKQGRVAAAGAIDRTLRGDLVSRVFRVAVREVGRGPDTLLAFAAMHPGTLEAM